MKRRNFLSGLLASPLALKARFLALFQKRPVELCGTPILEWSAAQPVQATRTPSLALTPHRREVVHLLAGGKSMKEVVGVLNLAPRTAACHPARKHIFYCSLPRGHKGPHMLVNRRVQISLS